MKKNMAIAILSMIIIGLSGYLVYDKAINKEELKQKKPPQKEGKTDNKEQEEKIEEKGLAYFEEYLYYFMPEQAANNFLYKIDSFSEEEINKYILYYYINKNKDSERSIYDVSSEEISKLVSKYFGIEDYKLKEDWGGREGIKRLDDNHYQIYWFQTGWYPPEYELTSVVYDGKNVKVTMTITDAGMTIFKENSEIIFHLVYNNGNYNLKSIESAYELEDDE